MVEHQQIVNVSEVPIIRVTCKSCESSIETKITNVGNVFREESCPFCKDKIVIPEAISGLATSIERLVAGQNKSSIDFVIRTPISE